MADDVLPWTCSSTGTWYCAQKPQKMQQGVQSAGPAANISTMNQSKKIKTQINQSTNQQRQYSHLVVPKKVIFNFFHEFYLSH